MSAYLNDLYTAFREVLAVAWPEVVANNIYEAEHADLIPWADYTIPYAVVLCEGLQAGEWGMDNLAYEGEVHIYYVAATKGPGTALRPKLEGARDALLHTSLSTGQVIDITGLDWGNGLTPNEIFTAKGMAHRAGMLTAQVVVGETFA